MEKIVHTFAEEDLFIPKDKLIMAPEKSARESCHSSLWN